jgi:hypothetical protein
MFRRTTLRLLRWRLWRRIRRHVGWGWALVGILATIVTLASGIVFFPRLSISSDVTLDSSNPFGTPFILKNDGYFSVYSVQVICLPLREWVPGANVVVSGIGYTSRDLKMPEIRPDQAVGFSCPEGISFSASRIAAVRMEFFVSFKATMFPSSCTKQCFPYVTKPDRNGNLRWFPDAPSTLANKLCDRSQFPLFDYPP